MPDDDYRPTHGLPPGSRPTNVPPDWWDLLDRNDLPKGGGEPGRGPRRRRGRDEDIIHGPDQGRVPRRSLRWRLWVTTLALIAIGMILLTLGLGTTTPKAIAAILLLLGIVVLLALVSLQVVRNTRRRG